MVFDDQDVHSHFQASRLVVSGARGTPTAAGEFKAPVVERRWTRFDRTAAHGEPQGIKAANERIPGFLTQMGGRRRCLIPLEMQGWLVYGSSADSSASP